MLARALVREPRLLLIDEPAVVPSLEEREALYELLRAGAREHKAALVVASEDIRRHAWDRRAHVDRRRRAGARPASEPATSCRFRRVHAAPAGGLERSGS